MAMQTGASTDGNNAAPLRVDTANITFARRAACASCAAPRCAVLPDMPRAAQLGGALAQRYWLHLDALKEVSSTRRTVWERVQVEGK